MGISKRYGWTTMTVCGLLAAGCQGTGNAPLTGAAAPPAQPQEGYHLAGGPEGFGPTLTIADGPGNQSSSAVAFDARTNQYLVVWQDLSIGDGDVFGRLVSADGAALGPIVPIATGANPQFHPRVAYNSQADEFLVTWTDFPAIAARRVSANGTPIGERFFVSEVARQDSDFAAVAYDVKANEYLVVWRLIVGLGPTIVGRRVSAGGQNIDGIVLFSPPGAAEGQPAIAYGVRADEFLVTWANAGDTAIIGQRFRPSAGLLDGLITIDATPGATKRQPTVAYNFHHNEFLVAWSDSRIPNPPSTPSPINFDIFARRIAPSGVPLDASTRVAGDPDAADNQPALAYSCPEDDYFLVWRREPPSGRVSVPIFGERLDTTGQPMGTPAVLFGNAQVPTEQSEPAIASDCNRPGFLATLTNLNFDAVPINSDVVGRILP